VTALAAAATWWVVEAVTRVNAVVHAGLRAAQEPTLTADSITTWWNETPVWAKLGVAVVALTLVVVGIVRRLVVLTFVAALIGLGLIGWWWWATYGSKL
jgi:hypothetical protein